MVNELGNGDEPKGDDEDGNVQQEKPLEEDKVRRDAAAKVTFNLLDRVSPELQRVGEITQGLLKTFPCLEEY